jgi:hypothetical protein
VSIGDLMGANAALLGEYIVEQVKRSFATVKFPIDAVHFLIVDLMTNISK